MNDFFEFNARDRYTPASRRGGLLDGLVELHLASSTRLKRLITQTAAGQRVLIVGVEVPAREGKLAEIVAGLSATTRHTVDVSTVPMKPQGKFANVQDAIDAAPRPLRDYDWLVITDDDIAFDTAFLDRYLSVAQAGDFAISQPAHRFRSYASYPITRRRFGSLARLTRFVEIGPITFLRAETFPSLIPFPETRWCWGLDLLWSDIAQRSGWRMGIIDAAPVGHLKPVAATYDVAAAIQEGRELLARHNVTSTWREVLNTRMLLRA